MFLNCYFTGHRIVLSYLALLAITAISIFAQGSEGRIAGVIVDQTGGSVPGATTPHDRP